MAYDELDDLLHPTDELEAAFRELDAQLKMEEMRRQRTGGRTQSQKAESDNRRSQRTGRGSKRTAEASRAGDPLKDLKAAFDGQPAARYLVVVCPGCKGKNRVPLERLRTELPVCGRCKTDLSFERR